MSECILLPTCFFFNSEYVNDDPKLVKMLKERYCRGDSSDCARLMVFRWLGRDKIPENMFPNSVGMAERLLRDSAA